MKDLRKTGIEDTNNLSLVNAKEQWEEKLFKHTIRNIKYLGA